MLDPIQRLRERREAARADGDPLASLCMLATASAAGAPALRTLVVRDLGPEGVTVIVSGASPKARDLQENPLWELLFLLQSQGHQFRLRGRGLEHLPAAELDALWIQADSEARWLNVYQAGVREQSSVLPSRETLLEELETLRERHGGEVPARPASVWGLRFVPEEVEVWERSPDWIHHRILYTRDGDRWTSTLLVP